MGVPVGNVVTARQQDDEYITSSNQQLFLATAGFNQRVKSTHHSRHNVIYSQTTLQY